MRDRSKQNWAMREVKSWRGRRREGGGREGGREGGGREGEEEGRGEGTDLKKVLSTTNMQFGFLALTPLTIASMSGTLLFGFDDVSKNSATTSS